MRACPSGNCRNAMAQFTVDQRAAISSRGENLLLAAAAGSGKTTVLIERVLSLIEEGARVERLLIVTFSRAAAADMKARLVEKLGARAQTDLRFARQLERVDRATIGTIHAFCAELLRAHFEAAGVDPAFRVLEPGALRPLAERAAQDALEAACAQSDAGFLRLLDGRTVAELSDMVRTLYDFAMERPDPDAWLDRALADAPDLTPFKNALLHDARQTLLTASASLALAVERCDEPLGPAVYRETIEAELQGVSNLFEAEFDELGGALAAFSFAARLPGLRPAKADPDADAKRDAAEPVKQLRNQAKDAIKALAQNFPPMAAAEADIAFDAPLRAALRELTRAYGERFAELKREKSGLSFGDLEHASLRALRDPGVRRALRKRYQHIFVDEYQDVSDLQEALLRLVARRRNRFMVGDVKQSIYRFRQAEPGLFADKYKTYCLGARKANPRAPGCFEACALHGVRPRGRRPASGRLIALSQNFRSRPAILACVNRVFERAMFGPNAEVVYDELAQLQPGATFDGPDAPVELHVLVSPDAAQASDDETEAPGEALQEGAFCAERIRALLGTPYYDARKGAYRPLAPRDFVVLARTRAALLDIEPLLTQAGIPAYADVSARYLGALEVRTALALLRVLENRRRDEPLLALLRSPMAGFSSTDLLCIRGENLSGRFSEACATCLSTEGECADRLRLFWDRLDRWQALAAAMPLPGLIDLLLRETGYFVYVGALPGGATRQGNLDLLVEYAARFEETDDGGLSGFLRYLDTQDKLDADMGAAHTLGEGDDVVRLMTAHKSKGLEFPVVLVTQLGRRLSLRPSRGELRVHRALGAGLTHVDEALYVRRDTLPRRAIEAACRWEDLEEEKRVLYVLMTRAIDRLILVGRADSADKVRLRAELARRAPIRPACPLDWLTPVFGDEMVFHSVAAQTEPAQAGDDARPAAPPDFSAAYAYRYPYEGEAFAPVKMTATGLTRTIVGGDALLEPAPRPRFLQGAAQSVTDFGTRVHRALARLPLEPLGGSSGAPLRAALEAGLAELTARGVLDQAPPVDALLPYLDSPLGRRMRQARALHREWPFNLAMTAKEAGLSDQDTPLLVQGVIDACFLEGDAWVLLDYKTDKTPEDEALLARYGAQLALYRTALERITQTPVRETYLLTRDRAIPVA